MKKILLSPDPIEGSASTGTPPPAADLVLKTPVEESDAGELVRAKRALEEEKAARKKDQMRISTLEDENRALKNIPLLPPEKVKEQKKSFLQKMNEFAEGL